MTTVKDADQAALDITELMGQAMSGTPQPRTVPSPSDIDPDAPHGRDDSGQPLAPFGWTKPQSKNDQPRPKLTASGRKSKDDTARVATVTPITKPPAKPDTPTELGRPKLPEHDYTADLAATSEAIWVGLSMGALLPLGKLPVISRVPIGKGRKLGELLDGMSDRIAAQAHIFNHNRGALVAALNIAANNSVRARKLAETLASGDATWALMAGAMIMPFASQSASLWTNTLEADGLPAAGELAKANQATLDSWIEKFNAELAAVAEEATASLVGDPA